MILRAAYRIALAAIASIVILGAAVAVIDFTVAYSKEPNEERSSYYLKAVDKDSFQDVTIAQPFFTFSRGEFGRIQGLFSLALSFNRALTEHDAFELGLPVGARNIVSILPTKVGDRTITDTSQLENLAASGDVEVSFSLDAPDRLKFPIETTTRGGARVVRVSTAELPAALALVDESDNEIGTAYFAIGFDAPAEAIYLDGLTTRVIRLEWSPSFLGTTLYHAWGDGTVDDSDQRKATRGILVQVCSCAFEANDLLNGGFSQPGPEKSSLTEGQMWTFEWEEGRVIEFPWNGPIPRWSITLSQYVCLPIVLGVPILELLRRKILRRNRQ